MSLDETTPEFSVPEAALLFTCLADWQLAKIWWMLEHNHRAERKANHSKAQLLVWQAMLTYGTEAEEQAVLAAAKPTTEGLSK